MKRGREEDDEQTLNLVNCLMLLSKPSSIKNQKMSDRVFVCKTCNREFSSFQALGGHRASHKKPGGADQLRLAKPSSPVVIAKKYECPICGMEFAIGQALGGHMRKHRDVLSASAAEISTAGHLPVLTKSNSSKRVSCLNLDLSLAPPGYHHHYDLAELHLTS